ncbi:MAG: DUF433 domain-containing protein [Gemmatimonadota bacterium]
MSRTTRQRLDTIVSRDPEIHSGDLVFRGTRVPVDTLVDHLKRGYGIEEYLEGFPSVERWQVEGYLELSLDDLADLIPRAERILPALQPGEVRRVHPLEE